MPQRKKIAIIGAGAAGCFCAVNIAEMSDEMDVCVFEAATRPMHKLSLTGGGRCNITNPFDEVDSLAEVYPRGHRLLKSLFYSLDNERTAQWFENHGIRLYAQDDNRIFPQSDDAMEVVDRLAELMAEHNVRLTTNSKVTAINKHDDGKFSLTFADDGDRKETFDGVVVTTGGMSHSPLMESLRALGHEMAEPVPSLFSLKVKDDALTSLMGATVASASVMITGTKLRAEGGLLVTHFGFSGPAVLRLSSYAARALAESNYRCEIAVNWTNTSEDETRASIQKLIKANAAKNVLSAHPEQLTKRLWEYLTAKAEISKDRTFAELGKKNVNKLVTVLTSDTYHVNGRGQYKEEFVTSGGVALSGINPKTLESKSVAGLFFDGEVMDIDAVTGGFNLQAAWTTGYVAARNIVESLRS
ncbi:MAG: aminoacetone oxidase family FAD-binding enzyme [Paludibacteraceae bacterium]|nr:aminoacetone oxidase family FAD-binding enzyme [Paludibacteraceae bacterium]